MGTTGSPITSDRSDLLKVGAPPQCWAKAQLKLISIAQRKNSRIAWVVLLSGIAELLALAMLAVAVILILR